MRPALALTLLTMVACRGGRGDAPDSTALAGERGPRSATAEQGGNGFTSMRSLPALESLAALSTRGTPPSGAGARDYSIRFAYDGARAQVVITSPDGQIIRDTTRPRDTSCDDFAPDTSSDPNADGIGCLAEEYGTTVSSSRPGVGYVQFTAADSGMISFSVEPFTRGNYVEGWWGIRGLRVRPGETYILRMTLPGRREDGPILVVPLTGPIDTLTAPR